MRIGSKFVGASFVGGDSEKSQLHYRKAKENKYSRRHPICVPKLIRGGGHRKMRSNEMG